MVLHHMQYHMHNNLFEAVLYGIAPKSRNTGLLVPLIAG
jgi:hypothetical protein